MYVPLLDSSFTCRRKRECLASPCFLPAPRLEKSKGLCIFWSCLISSGLSLRTKALKWKLSSMIDGFSFYLQVGNTENDFFPVGLTAYWYKSYFHFAIELICNIGV